MAGIHSEACVSLSSIESDSLKPNTLYEKDIISIKDLSFDEINLILSYAAKMKSSQSQTLLKDKIIANCFFEPSTRTRLSFETAVLRLGGNVIGFDSADSTSIKKGETLRDTIRMVSDYADLIVIRHPNEGAARLASEMTEKPVINAGDGANQHPTQTLTDLFTIQESQHKLDGLSVALVGDLRYSRTIHSFAQACVHFNMRLFLVSHPFLAMPERICDMLKNKGIRFSIHQTLEEVIPKVDVLYMTRVQQERFGAENIQWREKQYVLQPAMLKQAKSNLKIMHPLPRMNEIDQSIDAMPQAYYFQQAGNGVYVRQAILSLLLNRVSI